MSTDSVMRHSDRWLAVLRIATGAWFIKTIGAKWVLLGGVLPVPMASERWIETLPRILEGYAESNPVAWFQALLEDVLIPNAELLAHFTAIGEGLVGIGLTIGLLTRTSAVGGLFLLVVYELAALGLPFSRHGLKLFMILACVAFFFARAGMVWGVDGWLSRRADSGST
ncbi:MAG: DoxX family protein [Gammaproteobacteria bacterium]|nr:DoxX family protein [Gammaproteobacteria bacterium]MDH3410350.1 DoxX family protein [Gammaproteobacteria bacterium]